MRMPVIRKDPAGLCDFRWTGRDARGVPVYVRRQGIPPAWLCLAIASSGVGVASLAFLAYIGYQLAPWALFIFLAVAEENLRLGINLFRTRRRILRLSPADDLCARLNVDEAALKRLVEEREIVPRCHINGRDYYDLRDFGAAATLLRPTAPPDCAPNLLRPAAGPARDMPNEPLLRPAGRPGGVSAPAAGGADEQEESAWRT